MTFSRVKEYRLRRDEDVLSMDYAVTLMDIDEDISEEDLTKAFDFEGIIRVRIIR